MEYRSTEFGVYSSSGFPSRVQTDRKMLLNTLSHVGGYTAGMGYHGLV